MKIKPLFIIFFISISKLNAQNSIQVNKVFSTKIFDIDTIYPIKNKEITFTQTDTIYLINKFGLAEIQRLNKQITNFKQNAPQQLKSLQNEIQMLENDVKKLESNNDSLLLYTKNFTKINQNKIDQLIIENKELSSKITNLEKEITTALENTKTINKQNKVRNIKWGITGLVIGTILGLIIGL